LIKLFHEIQVANLICLERNVAIQHGIETNTSRPDIHRKALVSHIFNDFWSNIGWSSTLLEEDFILFNLSADSEIAKFDISMTVQQNIV
jgi:hypothetical protein